MSTFKESTRPNSRSNMRGRWKRTQVNTTQSSQKSKQETIGEVENASGVRENLSGRSPHGYAKKSKPPVSEQANVAPRSSVLRGGEMPKNLPKKKKGLRRLIQGIGGMCKKIGDKIVEKCPCSKKANTCSLAPEEKREERSKHPRQRGNRSYYHKRRSTGPRRKNPHFEKR